MRCVAATALALLVLVPASAGAGTTPGTTRPPLGLTATPVRVVLAGSNEATVRVANPGVSPVVVEVSRAGFALDLRGRPKIVPRTGARAATAWVAVRPARFLLRAGAGRALAVSSRLPAGVEPGDHDALVLLTTRPQRGAGVAVRMRLGIVVVVRAPGRVVRRLLLGRLRVRRARGIRILELAFVNRGNVTETLHRSRLHVSLRHGTARVRLRPETRDLRPGTGGLVQLPYRGRWRGWVTARVDLAGEPGRRAVGRTYRLRL